MTAKEVPVRFKASDGEEFDTKEEAERHDAKVTATRKFKEARHRLGRVLAESDKTADGERFDFTRWDDYYYVTPGWGGMPGLSRVSFYVWSCDFDVDDMGRVTISYRKGNADRAETYRIADLYADEKKAKKSLLKAQEKWLKERAEDVEELRAELA